MDEQIKVNGQSKVNEISKANENVLFGIVGAFLFSLAGGILYYVLYQIGYLAAISGLVGVVCAIKGYEFFSKGSSIRGIVISVIVAILVIVIAWYCCLAGDVYNAYQMWYEEGLVDFVPTYFECLRFGYEFLAEIPEYYGELAISLILSAVGCTSYIVKTVKDKKAKRREDTKNASGGLEE